MRNFIQNIIDRLSGFIYGNTRQKIGEPVFSDTIPVLDGCAPGIVPERFDTAALTPEGLRLHGFRYQNAALTRMLSRMSPGDTVKVKIPDPGDASSIFVWDSTARPQPQWLTVAAAGAAEAQRLSFAHHAAARKFAKAQNFDFDYNTDEQHSRLTTS